MKTIRNFCKGFFGNIVLYLLGLFASMGELWATLIGLCGAALASALIYRSVQQRDKYYLWNTLLFAFASGGIQLWEEAGSASIIIFHLLWVVFFVVWAVEMYRDQNSAET